MLGIAIGLVQGLLRPVLRPAIIRRRTACLYPGRAAVGNGIQNPADKGTGIRGDQAQRAIAGHVECLSQKGDCCHNTSIGEYVHVQRVTGNQIEGADDECTIAGLVEGKPGTLLTRLSPDRIRRDGEQGGGKSGRIRSPVQDTTIPKHFYSPSCDRDINDT